MTTCTPLGLVYPEGSDRPCDVAPTTCEFSEGVEGYLDQLDDLVNRTATTVPMVWLQTLEPVTVTQGAVALPTITPIFDTVVVDTANMADLTSNPSEITITRTGIYMFGFYTRGKITLVAGTSQNVLTQVNPTGPISFPPGGGGTGFNSYLPNFRSVTFNNGYLVAQTNWVFITLTAGETYSITISPSGTDTDSFTMTECDLYCIWMGDMS